MMKVKNFMTITQTITEYSRIASNNETRIILRPSILDMRN